MSEDFYNLLSVSRDATDREIKKAHRKLARQFHPDNKDTGNEEKFKQIQLAYETLSDAQKRQVYDQVGHEAFMNAGQRAGHGAYGGEEMFNGFEDLFESFFGGGSGFGGRGGRGGRRSSGENRPQRGNDLQSIVEIDFLEACFGIEQDINFERNIACTACKGSGADPKHKPETCSTCAGHGEVQTQTQSFLGMITQVTTCPTCHGSGKQIKYPCKSCHGKKFESHKETLNVKIPAGIDHGMKLVLEGKGHDGLYGGPSGDYYLGVRVKPSKEFIREDLNIVQNLEISIADSILGNEIPVKTIHGEETIKIQPGTQSNATHTIYNKGIKLVNGRKGNHLLNITVKIPKAGDLPSALQDELKKMQDKNSKDKKKFFGF